MLTIYESERLIKLLRDKNNRQTLNADYFTYDYDDQEIVANNRGNDYEGRREIINIFPRLENKYNNHRAFKYIEYELVNHNLVFNEVGY